VHAFDAFIPGNSQCRHARAAAASGLRMQLVLAVRGIGGGGGGWRVVVDRW
jgi:hypothetical protein